MQIVVAVILLLSITINYQIKTTSGKAADQHLPFCPLRNCPANCFQRLPNQRFIQSTYEAANETTLKSSNLQSSLRDWNGMDWPRIIFTSSSFLAFPVTNVTGFVNVICSFVSAIPGPRCCSPSASVTDSETQATELQTSKELRVCFQ